MSLGTVARTLSRAGDGGVGLIAMDTPSSNWLASAKTVSGSDLVNPRPLLAVPRLEGRDLRRALQRHGDLVQSFEQGLATRGLHRKGMALAGGRSDGHLGEIDANAARTLARLDLAGQALHRLPVEHHGQQAVLEAGVEEDVAEARADDAADAGLVAR